MCHVHAFRNLDPKLKSIEDLEKRKEVHSDMHNHLLFAPNDEGFDTLLTFCLEKWKSWQIDSVNSFANHLEVSPKLGIAKEIPKKFPKLKIMKHYEKINANKL